MTQRPRQQTRPLDGLRVLDLSRAVSGPFAGRILADLGANVVRAELPGTDVTQAFGKVTRGRSGCTRTSTRASARSCSTCTRKPT